MNDDRTPEPTAPSHTGSPEILIMVRQVIGGQMVQTIHQIEVAFWQQSRRNIVDQVIRDGLAELDKARRAGPRGTLP